MATRSDELVSCGPSDAVSSVLSGCILDGDSLILPNIPVPSLGELPVPSPEDELMLLPTTPTSEDTPHISGPRKSDRERREKRSFSPDHQRSQYPGTTKGRRKKATPRKLKRTDEPDQQITCELCFSPYVCNPLNQHPTAKKSRYRQSWRNKIDRNTGKLMVLCNACGIAYDRPPKVSKAKPRPPPEDKQRYLEEAQEFAASLVKELNDTDAERLSCPHFKTEGCGCLQRYIMANDNIDDSRNRAVDLLNLLKKAKELSQKKFYDPDKAEAEGKNLKRPRNIGLGNGQKRSKEFEEFVLLNRKILRDELMLCERATQRVLMYSNNFLHKKLKTESRSCRVERTKGKYVLGLLKPIASLVKEKCCTFRCVRMAVSLSSLLEEWRKRAASGQREARRVIAEMLTPSGGARPNCYNFIELVTGCSFSTIGKVNEQMRKSGGSREPPAHGMCRYWEKHSTKKRPHTEEEEGEEDGESREYQQDNMEPMDEASHSLMLEAAQEAAESAEAALSLEPFPVVIMPEAVPLVPNKEEEAPEPADVRQLTTVELQSHRQQITALQRQLSQQQVQLQQQQQLLQQQMLHQVLLDQVNGTSGVHIQTLQSLQQLLNLQQQYQQQQLTQLTQLEEQAGIVDSSSSAEDDATSTSPAAATVTSPTAGQVLNSPEFLQLPPSLTLPQLLPQLSDTVIGADGTQTQQPIVFMQSLESQPQLLQQQLQQHSLVVQAGTDSLLNIPCTDVAETSQEEGQSVVVVSEADDALDTESADRSANIESLVQIPVSSSSVSSVILPAPSAIHGKASSSSNGPMLQQVIDLGQLGLGLQTLNPSQTSLLGADTSQLLSNLNITLVQSAPGANVGGVGGLGAVSSSSVINGIGSLPMTVMSASDAGDLTQASNSGSVITGATEESLTQLLASSLGYTVLTIEPNMTITDTEGGTTVVTDANVTVGDKDSTDTPMFVDLDPGTVVDSDGVINAPDESQVGKTSIVDVGLKGLGDSETVGDEEGTTEMSPSEVLQLLVQHGIAGQDRLINQVQ